MGSEHIQLSQTQQLIHKGHLGKECKSFKESQKCEDKAWRGSKIIDEKPARTASDTFLLL